MKKRILILLNNLNIGGAQLSIINLLKPLSKKALFDFVVEGSDVGSLEDKLILEFGSKIFHFPKLTKHPFLYRKMLKRIVKENKYNVVHANLNFLSIFPLRWVRKMTITLSHAHACYPSSNWISKAFRKYFRRKICKYTRARLACSEEAGKWLYGNCNFIVIPSSIDISSFSFQSEKRKSIRKLLGIPLDSVVIINVGNLTPVKRQHFLIDCFINAFKLDSKYKLLILGDGYLKNDLLQHIKKHEADKQISLLGTVNNVADYLSASDCFVFTSLFEGFPVSVLEARANGLPCLVSESLIQLKDAGLGLSFANAESIQSFSKELYNAAFEKRFISDLSNYDSIIISKTLWDVYDKE